MTGSKRTPMAAVAAAVVLASGTAAADTVLVEGSIRARATVLLNHDFDAGRGSPDNYASLRTRIGLATTVGEYASAYVQLQDSRVFGEPRNTVTSLEQVDLHQGYIHLHNAFNTSLEFKIGRQELAYGTHRQVGSLDWSDIGRSFDGLLAMYDIEDVGWLHLFAMKTLETGGIPVGVNDGDGVTREPGAINPERAFVGSYLHLDITTEAVAEAYLFDLYEDLPIVFDDDQQEIVDPNSHRFTAGGRWRWRGEGSSPSAFHAEGAVQFGKGPETVPEGSTQVQEGSDITAYAFTVSARLGLGRLGAWIAGQVDFASGDPAPGEGNDETYRQLFPTGHRVLGHLDFVGWQNVMAWQIRLGASPDERWQVAVAHHVFELAEPADTWYAADGQPFDAALQGNAAFDASLGRELDVRIAFVPEPGLRFEVVAGMWWPGTWQEQASALRDGADLDTASNRPPALDRASSVYALTTVAW